MHDAFSSNKARLTVHVRLLLDTTEHESPNSRRVGPGGANAYSGLRAYGFRVAG